MDKQAELFSAEAVVGLIKKNVLIILLLLAGVILLGIGLIQLFGQQSKSIEFIESQKVEGENTKLGSIFVDISGMVEIPGVYQLEADSRIQDALSAAGGLSADADREYVSKNLNLAKKVTDGMKIYIPGVGEKVNIEQQGVSSIETGLININTSSISLLETLPRVGPVTAGKIVNARPYSTIDELYEKKVMGAKTFEQLKDLVTVD